MFQGFCHLAERKLGNVDGQRLVEPQRRAGHKPREEANRESDDSQCDDFGSSVPVCLSAQLGVRLARHNVVHGPAEYCR